MVGKFHRFSKKWSESSNINRHSYDKELLIRMMSKIKDSVILNAFPSEKFKVIEGAVNEISNRIDMLNFKIKSRGVVHSDLSKSNLIINGGQIVPIDFCLSGNSYYYMDLGSLFCHFDKQEQQNCIIKGYKNIIDEEINAKYIEAFMVFQIILFISTHLKNAPKSDWYNDTLNRWCREFFIPFSNNIPFIVVS